MIIRKYLETLREHVRKVKWLAADGKATTDVQMEAAWCADYISELLSIADDDVILRTFIAPDCSAEVRYTRHPKGPEEIDVLIEMLSVTKSAFGKPAALSTTSTVATSAANSVCKESLRTEPAGQVSKEEGE